MHSFFKKPVKQLKMRKLLRKEIGPFKGEMIDLLACSSDPYSGVIYEIEIDNCRQRAKDIGAELGKHITFTPVITKLIGHAIAENPAFNQLLLGGDLYQLEEIHVANLILVPGTEALTYVMIENPHLKTLADIQQALFSGIARAREAFAVPPRRLDALLAHLVYKYGLYRLIGEKRVFTAAYERGLLSNISLSVHTYATPANFVMVKDVITPIRFLPKIHACGPFRKPVLDDGMLVSKDMLQLHVTTDHRLINGMHSYQLGQSLARMAAHPEQYLA